MSDQRRQPSSGDSLEKQLLAARKRNAVLDAELAAANQEIKRLNDLLTMDDRPLLKELLTSNEKIQQLGDAYSHKDNEAFQQHDTIETLKVELRAISAMTARLQSDVLSARHQPAGLSAPQRPALGGPTQDAEPPREQSQAAEEAQARLEAALMDLEDRLQQAVGLVLNELNTRKAAEARIRELEEQLAAARRRIGGEG